MPDADYAAAFAEVKRKAQPAAEPPLTYGDGVTPDPEMELDAIILAHTLAGEWTAETAYVYGARILPSVRNGHRYKCVTPGTSAATEPSWSTVDFAQVTDGTAVWVEDGPCRAPYDTQGAIYEAMLAHRDKSAEYGDKDEASFFDKWERVAKAYAPVGIA